ncbi:Zinc finger protein GIS2 [Carex littledalei]|uniref:Zinc finger protein GIS2 n=1 Tax=Carex littledalei TaxID=544730 RepID=A0A833QL82_9POAL|nr:Zinc finger protein GIS2 [Carex littledalei]
MSLVAQLQMVRIREKYKQITGLEKPSPPLMAPNGPSYKEVVNRPQAWKPKPHFPLRQHQETKSELINRKLNELRSRSTPKNPICFRCGSAGHLAHDCRNGRLCFLCNRLGHTSRVCKNNTSFFPHTPPPKTPENPRTRRTPLKPQRTRSNTMAAPLRTPIVTLLPTRESEQIEKEFAQSFILDDIGGWGPSRIEKTLTQKFKHTRHHRWVATIYTEWQYLIKAPSTAWLNSVAARGSLTLEGVEFPVLAWEPDFDDGLDLTPIWLGVCDVRLIPPIHYVEYLNPSGKIRVFDLHIEIESAKTKSVHAWTARLNGRPYPNGTEFGLPPIDEDEDLLIHELSSDAAAVGVHSETGPQIVEEASNNNLMDTGTVSPVRGTPPANCRPNSGLARKRDEDDGSAGSGKRIVGLGGTAGSNSKPGGSGSKPGGSGKHSGSGSKSAPKGTGTQPVWAAPKSGLAARLRSSTPKFKPVEGVIVVSDVSDHPDQPLITTPAVTDTATSS